MPKIFFDMFPAKGHYHATLKLAALLQQANHQVIYGIVPEFAETVAKHGFEFKECNPFIFEPIKSKRILNKGSFFINNLFGAISNERLKHAREGFNAFKLQTREINPDLVLLDEQNVYKAVFYEILKIPVVVFQTMPDTRKIKNIPPFTSFLMLSQNLLGKIKCYFLWGFVIIKKKVKYHFESIIYFGQNDLSMYKKLTKENGVELYNRIDWARSFGNGVKSIPRLIISPKAFDFPHTEKNNVFRVGPLIDIKREDQIQNPRYQSILNKINLAKEQGLIIYCSMGTVSGNDLKRTLLFFKKVVKSASKNTEDLYILSTGKFLDINQLLPLPNNVFVFEQLPQVDLLQYCDLMITHGGMNSINECVYSEVPMLIYPLSLKWDQPGNSARAVYHGLGLRGRIKRDSVKTISKKINIIESNYGMYKTNVRKMKIKFEEQNNSKEVVQIIESFINSNTINNDQ